MLESKRILSSLKWLLLFLFLTVGSYFLYLTSQPHYHTNLKNTGHLLSLYSIDPGIAIISTVTAVILTAIAYHEFKKRNVNQKEY